MPGPLDGGAQGPLVLGADTALAARLNLGPVGNVAAQALVVLVVDVLDVLHAEGTYPPARGVASARTATGPGALPADGGRAAGSRRGLPGGDPGPAPPERERAGPGQVAPGLLVLPVPVRV